MTKVEFFIDIFQYQYLANALLAAIFAGIMCGIVGTYIVSRRMVFLCGGITHASFGGFGIALYAGIAPTLGALVFAILSALGIEWASDKGKIREDSAIGIIWSIGMAIGAFFMSLAPGYTSGDLASYMFGSIITVSSTEVIVLAIFTLLCIAGIILWWRPIMQIAFDRSFAKSQGIATDTISYLLSAVVAITIVLAIKIMGIVLLLSLFTIPAVTANTITKAYHKITILSTLIAVFGAVVGLICSYTWEIPPGTCIIFVLSAMLFLTKILSLQNIRTPHKNENNS